MARQDHLCMPEEHMEKLYNSPHLLVRFVHQQRIRNIVRAVPLCHQQSVLDVGCGEGHLLHALHMRDHACAYYGIDVTPIALCKAQIRCPFAQICSMDASSMSFPSETFDVVIISEVLEHIYEYESVVDECMRVLRPGGLFVVTFPNEVLWTFARFLLGRRPVKVPDHINAFTPRSMRTIVKEVCIIQRHLPLTLPFCLSLTCLMAFRKAGKSHFQSEGES